MSWVVVDGSWDVSPDDGVHGIRVIRVCVVEVAVAICLSHPAWGELRVPKEPPATRLTVQEGGTGT